MNRARLSLLALLVITLISTASADWKMKTKTSMAGMGTEGTVYVKGQRQRTETGGPMGMKTVSILQCDQKRTIQISDSCKTYMIEPLEDGAAGASAATAKAAAGKKTKGGTITFNIALQDTGERKDMFGYNARHIKSTMSSTASPDACQKGSMSMESDGWYADLAAVGLTCSTDGPPMQGPPPQNGCVDKIKFTRSGSGRMGFPLKVSTTIKTAQGNFTTTTETVEVSKATLQDSLFDIPAGYKEVTDPSQLFCGNPMMGGMGAGNTGGQDYEAMIAEARKQAEAQMGEVEDGDTSGGEGEGEAAGRLRIGIAKLENKSDRPARMGELREQLIREFEGLDVEAVRLDAETHEEVQVEAKEKGVAYILYTEVFQVKEPSKAKKLGGLFGKATGTSSGDVGGSSGTLKLKIFRTGEQNPLTEGDVKGEGQGAVDALSDALSREAQLVVERIQLDLKSRK